MIFFKNTFKTEKIINSINKKKSDYWSLEQRKLSLRLFHLASLYVPAYKKFIKSKKINPSSIRKWSDFKKIPCISKNNYLKQNSLNKLCWDGHLNKPLVFTSTSGSTGEPFYFPRQHQLDWQYSIIIEHFLRNNKYFKKNQPILVIIGFGMGVWIGGLITYKAFEIVAHRLNFPLSIITPGINKQEIFKALKNLAPYYKQVILIGYPPFIKDVIDEAQKEGIDFKKINLRLIFAAEAFTEEFRDYLINKTNIKNRYLDTMNIYGTADIGAMAFETPLSILIRTLASKNKNLFNDIFGRINKTPTLAQYNPLFIGFETENGDIILTGNNAIPLIRYKVGDHGGVYSYDEMIEILNRYGIDIFLEAKKADIAHTLNEFPFVFVFERDDFSTTLYGLQVYPETIREVLIKSPFNDYLTGKFTMLTKFNQKQDQYLEINIELKKNIQSLPYLQKKHLLKRIVQNLREKNSEYRELFNHLKNRALPKLVFWPYEHPEFFRPGIKQKWVKK